MRRRVGVLGQPVARVGERGDDLGDVEPVDEVIKHGLGRRVRQVVAAVVHDQQRVTGGAAEPGRQVERHRAVAAQRPARHHRLDQRPGPRFRVGPRPVRYLVPVGVADRGTADRAVREPGVQRVVDPFAVAAARHLQLVLHPRALGQLEDGVPQVGAVQPAQPQVVGQPEDPVDEEHLVGLAPVQERAAGPLDDGDLMPRQEAVDGGRVERPAVAQPVDG